MDSEKPPSVDASSECRAAATTVVLQRPPEGTKSAAAPQKVPTTARKPPVKWTEDAKQNLLQKLREADGKFPTKTVLVYADFIAANLQGPVKFEELLTFLRQRDADDVAVVERIARLAQTLRP